jgi:NADH-ubiquinone oxidoreductase chain 6
VVFSLFFSFLILGLHAVSPLPFVRAIIFSCASLMLVLWVTANKWMSYRVFLIFLGGMMVVFLYARILSSNEKLIFKFRSFIALGLAFFMGLIIFSLAEGPKLLIISKIYSNIYMLSTMFLIVYLLMVLFIVVKLAEPLKGSLRKKF